MIVTISREYGAGGLGVADGVARALGYELMTDDLPANVAARLGGSNEELAARADSDAPLSERMLSNLGAGMPESVSAPADAGGQSFDDHLRAEVEREIRRRAAVGDVVILGRLGSAVLAGTPGMVRIFLTAGIAWRTERVMESFHFSRARAIEEIDRIDASRRRNAKERFKMMWSDPRHYDLVVDTSRFGIDGATELVVAAVRAAERV